MKDAAVYVPDTVQIFFIPTKGILLFAGRPNESVSNLNEITTEVL